MDGLVEVMHGGYGSLEYVQRSGGRAVCGRDCSRCGKACWVIEGESVTSGCCGVAKQGYLWMLRLCGSWAPTRFFRFLWWNIGAFERS